MGLIQIFYKIGQAIGCGASIFIAFWLITHPYFEPILAVRIFEIIGSIIAAIILFLDAIDIHPAED
jgi:hypothetical protein